MKCMSCKGRGCAICSNTGKFIAHGTKDTNERYTPPFIIEAAREAMGTIDVDVASCALANRIVQAAQYYDYKANGLTKEWNGNIWCNPPYGVAPNTGIGLQQLFLDKGQEEYKAGRARKIIYLLDAAVIYNPYFRPFLKYAICLYAGRIEFWNAEEDMIRSRGNIILYMGDATYDFYMQFKRYGEIITSMYNSV